MLARKAKIVGLSGSVLLLVFVCWHWSESLLYPAFLACQLALGVVGILVSVTKIFKNRIGIAIAIFVVLSGSAWSLSRIESEQQQAQADLQKMSEKEELWGKFRELMEQAKKIDKGLSSLEPKARAFVEVSPGLAFFSLGEPIAINADLMNVGPDPAHGFGQRTKVYIVPTIAMDFGNQRRVSYEVQDQA